MITMHVIAYVLIIILDFLLTFVPYADLKELEILVICNIAVYSFCNVIFGLIVN